MKQLLLLLWRKRWCRLLGVGVIVCALPLLHPYPRQSLFGPQIDGVPWCVYEDQIRCAARRGDDPSRVRKVLAAIGLAKEPAVNVRDLLETPSMLPLFMQLADDEDVKVRQIALYGLHFDIQIRNAKSVPVLRRHLDDPDPICRLAAARGVWVIERDRHVTAVVCLLCRDDDHHISYDAGSLLFEILDGQPIGSELFEAMDKLTDDRFGHGGLAIRAILSMGSFGSRGVPTLRRQLNRSFLTLCVVRVAKSLGRDARELVPDLLTLRDHTDDDMRKDIAEALFAIDPVRFPEPPLAKIEERP